jgi:hypothetical protein
LLMVLLYCPKGGVSMERIMIFRRKFVYKKRGAVKTENKSL